ncbi:MAG: helicase-associated domain-containing protein [Chloroflexi bacterium]|nr:helicase-associated domain-containing protein [Chloroflexota bacterium]
MPELLHSLSERDLGFLKIVAGYWGVPWEAPEVHSAPKLLAAALLDSHLVAEILVALPDGARQALATLKENQGRMPWAAFTRRFGEVREMGPARRDREQPYLEPVSNAEVLWYRGLVGRAFFDTGGEPLEYAYIPDDLLVFIPAEVDEKASVLGGPAQAEETAVIERTSDNILDQACTFLAALRLGLEHIPPGTLDFAAELAPLPFLQKLLDAAGLLDPQGLPLPEPVRAFLEAPRGEALAQLYRVWLDSSKVNELRMLPGLKCEGEWTNDPVQTRRLLLGWLKDIPAGEWWNLEAFLESVHERHPDFQRPAGDYDSWFIRRESDGEFLRGFDTWVEVDGMLLRYLITRSLHWLGMLDLAGAKSGSTEAFRLSAWSAALMNGEIPQGLPLEDAPIRVTSNGVVRLPHLASRAARYQISRFSAWQGEREGEYLYRITAASLERAKNQGLRLSHLLGLLKKYAADPISPRLFQALERWEQNGVQARLEKAVVLRLANPELLAALRKSRASRFLGDPLGPTAVIVKPGAMRQVVQALAEMGFLVGGDEEG